MREKIQDFLDEYLRYKITVEKAMDQVPDDALNRIVAPDGNSIGMIVRHLSGNLTSRFTDFLSTDGEKPWRDRDSEFETREYGARRLMTYGKGDGPCWRRNWPL